jgi:hypothetical protein
MGYYHEPAVTPPEEKPPGCLETLLITRVVFAVLLPIVVAMALLMVDIGAIFVLYAVHPALALIPVAISAAAIWLVARWDQRRHRPSGF